MSKEQTPITAEELYISIADILGRHWGIDVENTKKCVEIAEQYAKSKVLEALEKEFTELGLMAEFYYHDDGLHYYETAVKPKYEK